MRVEVFIAKHERYEAIEIYKDQLSPEQIEQIETHDGRVKLDIDFTGGHCFVELL